MSAAATPELVGRMQAHKRELLALLGQGNAPECSPSGQNRPVANAGPAGSVVGRPAVRECIHKADVPHEPSFKDKIAGGFVPAGWTPKGWRDRLYQLADRCATLHPDLAREYRTWARSVMAPLDK